VRKVSVTTNDPNNLRSVRGADFVDGKLVRDELVV
jgi:hypothetical protein